jgi:hypothetical protein
MGDLNYRIRGTRETVQQLVELGDAGELHSNDQLRWSMDTGLSFVGFEEAVIEFRPTYKFDTGSDVYDSGPKQRIPAWTDRVLYATNAGTECMCYNSDSSLRTSDHRPVYASFCLHLDTSNLELAPAVRRSVCGADVMLSNTTNDWSQSANNASSSSSAASELDEGMSLNRSGKVVTSPVRVRQVGSSESVLQQENASSGAGTHTTEGEEEGGRDESRGVVESPSKSRRDKILSSMEGLDTSQSQVCSIM